MTHGVIGLIIGAIFLVGIISSFLMNKGDLDRLQQLKKKDALVEDGCQQKNSRNLIGLPKSTGGIEKT